MAAPQARRNPRIGDSEARDRNAHLERQLADLRREFERCEEDAMRALLRLEEQNAALESKNREVERTARELQGRNEELDRNRREAQYLATHCSLCKLPNRALFHDRLAQALAAARRGRHRLSVLFLDLDRFKFINDNLGHSAGDQVLKTIADRLRSVVRESDTVARYGGDEFVVLLGRIRHDEDAARVARKLVRVVSLPMNVGGRTLRITTSVGIAIYPGNGDDVESLVSKADAAMYCGKQEGKNRYRFYTPEMNQASLEKLSLESSLAEAVERQELVLHFQPLVDGGTARIIGAEALLRWNHPQKGLVRPDHFIPLAEETGLIVEVGEWVLRAACRQNREWQLAGLPAVPISVNVSAQQFLDLQELVEDTLQESGLDSEKLHLEITETCLTRDFDASRRMLNNIRKLGVKISLDDFGTGFSSLSVLDRLPLDVLKIDRSFVSKSGTAQADRAITSTIVALAKTLGMEPVAEGVETDEQRKFLLEAGCRSMQGYLFSRPVPEPEFRLLLAAGRVAIAEKKRDPAREPDA